MGGLLQVIFERWRAAIVAVIGMIALLAGFLTNAEKIIDWLDAWLRPVTNISVSLVAPADRELVVVLTQGNSILKTRTIKGGQQSILEGRERVFYHLFWQGDGFKAEKSTNEILGPANFVLEISGSEQGQDKLLLKNRKTGTVEASGTLPGTLVQASLAAPAPGDAQSRPAGFGLLPELDRALIVVGLFEWGTTECMTRVAMTPVGLSVGCIAFGLPGPLNEIVKRIDRERPSLLAQTLGDNAAFIRQVTDGTTFQYREQLSEIFRDADKRRSFASSFEALARTPEFRALLQELTLTWYTKAVDMAAQSGLQSERGVLLIFDRTVQQGSGAFKRIHCEYERELRASNNVSENDKLRILSKLFLQRAPQFLHDSIARRTTTITSGRGTIKGIEFDLTAMGIREDVPMRGFVARAAPPELSTICQS